MAFVNDVEWNIGQLIEDLDLEQVYQDLIWLRGEQALQTMVELENVLSVPAYVSSKDAALSVFKEFDRDATAPVMQQGNALVVLVPASGDEEVDASTLSLRFMAASQAGWSGTYCKPIGLVQAEKLGSEGSGKLHIYGRVPNGTYRPMLTLSSRIANFTAVDPGDPPPETTNQGDIFFLEQIYDEDGDAIRTKIDSGWGVGRAFNTYVQFNGAGFEELSAGELQSTFVGVHNTDPQYTLDIDGDINLLGGFFRQQGFPLDSWLAGPTIAARAAVRQLVFIDTSGPPFDLAVPDGSYIDKLDVDYVGGNTFRSAIQISKAMPAKTTAGLGAYEAMTSVTPETSQSTRIYRDPISFDPGTTFTMTSRMDFFFTEEHWEIPEGEEEPQLVEYEMEGSVRLQSTTLSFEEVRGNLDYALNFARPVVGDRPQREARYRVKISSDYSFVITRFDTQDGGDVRFTLSNQSETSGWKAVGFGSAGADVGPAIEIASTAYATDSGFVGNSMIDIYEEWSDYDGSIKSQTRVVQIPSATYTTYPLLASAVQTALNAPFTETGDRYACQFLGSRFYIWRDGTNFRDDLGLPFRLLFASGTNAVAEGAQGATDAHSPLGFSKIDHVGQLVYASDERSFDFSSEGRWLVTCSYSLSCTSTPATFFVALRDQATATVFAEHQHNFTAGGITNKTINGVLRGSVALGASAATVEFVINTGGSSYTVFGRATFCFRRVGQ